MILCDELLFKRKIASGGRKPTGGECREAVTRDRWIEAKLGDEQGSLRLKLV